jgi:hypothetical protein
VHLSTLPTESGFQYVNGWGWSVTYTGKMLLPTDTAQNRWKEYWINVFVEDIGGFGPDLLGQFTLTGRSGCKFDNGSPTLLTDTRHWKVTEGQPQSYMQGAVHTGYPSWVTTYLPAFVQPTLIPASLGINGSGPSPWGVIPTNNLSAEWISAPGAPWNRAAWFQTHITCTP